MEILVDNRETHLRQLFHQNNVPITEKNLIHGDIVIKTVSNDEIFAIFERKTLSDLSSSIIDTRYSNQKCEMLNTYDRSIIFYIIEGMGNESGTGNFSYSIEDKKLVGAVINTMLRDDIRVFVTKDLVDTYNLIHHIYKNSEKILTPKSHKLVLKKEKHLGKADYFKNVLIQVPGVSEKIALEIVKKYSSLKDFYHGFSNIKTKEEKLKQLNSIKLNNNRAISKTALNNILEYVLYGDSIQPKESPDIGN